MINPRDYIGGGFFLHPPSWKQAENSEPLVDDFRFMLASL